MTDLEVVISIVGWAGVVLYLIAYYAVSTGRLPGRSPAYQLLNLIAAVGVAANAFFYRAYPSAIVNVIWFAIAVAILIGAFRARDELDPAHPESLEGQTMYRPLFFVGCILALFGLVLAVMVLMPRPPRPMEPVLVFTQDWQPYITTALPGGGPLPQAVRELFHSENYDAQIRFTDWADALDKVESGVGIAAFPFIDHRDRAVRLLFTDPLLEFDYVIFYRRGLTAPTGQRDEDALQLWLDAQSARANPAVDGPGASAFWDGPPLRLATVAGYALWPELTAIASVDVHATNPAEAFRMLEQGQVDLVVEGLLVGRHTIRDPTTGVDAARITATRLDDPRARAREPLRLVTSMTRSGEALRDRLNARLAELRRQGDLDELERRIEASDAVKVGMRAVTTAHRRQPDGTHTDHFLPAGTLAIVLQWPLGFEPDVGHISTDRLPPPDPQLCVIKVLNGPLRGWQVLVDPESFTILEQGLDP